MLNNILSVCKVKHLNQFWDPEENIENYAQQEAMEMLAFPD